MSTERNLWGSRLGFVLAAAGSSVGLGAIWKFPYMAGANGGGAFLLVYLLAVVGIGISMMLAELSIGRATHTDAVGAFGQLGGKKWRFFGYFSLLAAFIILSFYCVVGGWTVGYLVKALTGSLLKPEHTEGFKEAFVRFIGDPVLSLVFFAIFMALTCSIILGGIKSGIERVSKILMPLLFLLIMAMIVRSVTLPNAIEGIRFFLIPDVSKITAKTLIDALGFACFSLSLGFGGMLTYGSYMQKQESMRKAAVWVVVLQTLCVLMAGFMVLPAVFAFGMTPTEGPTLTYITLPAVFKAMPGGSIFAILFFALLLIAALTSSVSIIEPLVTYLIDQFRWSRKKACAVVAITSFIAGIPASWSFGDSNLFTLFSKTAFDMMDYVTSNLMLPINVLAACILMGWVVNKTFLYELQQGETGKPKWILLVNFCCKFIAPIVIVAILLGSFFYRA